MGATPTLRPRVPGALVADWWARLGLNQRPLACEANALPLSYAPAPNRATASKYTGLGYGLSTRVSREVAIQIPGYRFVLRLRATLADCDMLGHVNNVSYIRWAENARCEYFQEVLLTDVGGREGIIQPRIEWTYERQVRYREDISVGCRITRIGTKSFDMEYEAWSEAHGVRCGFGLTPQVSYNYETQQTTEVPRAWRERILAFETHPVAIASPRV
jgi:acyl-CoA thioester hydrolase